MLLSTTTRCSERSRNSSVSRTFGNPERPPLEVSLPTSSHNYVDRAQDHLETSTDRRPPAPRVTHPTGKGLTTQVSCASRGYRKGVATRRSFPFCSATRPDDGPRAGPRTCPARPSERGYHSLHLDPMQRVRCLLGPGDPQIPGPFTLTRSPV